MKRNSTEQLNQTSQLPSLRIVYKTSEVSDNKPVNPAKKTKENNTAAKPLVKEPPPMFNDYKFKARDYDPL
jgi:hypothetical protein